jgi:hypothetical protein
MIAWFGAASAAQAAAPIELELATQRGVQITAPHEWLQLLAPLGIDDVRIRGARPGDEPRVENRGSAQRPRYYALGILTAQNQLLLPGGRFSKADRGQLQSYFERLAAEGGEAMTAPRGMFGLTQKEVDAVIADFAQSVEFETKGQLPRAVIDRLQSALDSKVVIDPDADAVLGTAAPVRDELKGLSIGTSVAMILRVDALVLRPEKPRGQPVVYRIARAGDDAIRSSTLGKTNDHNLLHWPIGWEPPKATGEIAPSLFEFLNAEIDGYTLDETLAAIGPRLKIPLYLDHAATAEHNIDPGAIQVRMPRTRTFYKRILDRVLAQARLGADVRIDEAGAPFLWITR